MDTIFMNSENSRTPEPHILKLKLTDKLYLNYKSSYNYNKFKISSPTWNEEFTLPDGSYSVLDIQDYFQYILKKHGENTDKPSIKIYVN